MKATFQFDEETDGKEMILMTVKAQEAFSLLEDIDNRIRSMLKHGEVYSCGPEDLFPGQNIDTLDLVRHKNLKMTSLLEEIRSDIREIQL